MKAPNQKSQNGQNQFLLFLCSSDKLVQNCVTLIISFTRNSSLLQCSVHVIGLCGQDCERWTVGHTIWDKLHRIWTQGLGMVHVCAIPRQTLLTLWYTTAPPHPSQNFTLLYSLLKPLTLPVKAITDSNRSWCEILWSGGYPFSSLYGNLQHTVVKFSSALEGIFNLRLDKADPNQHHGRLDTLKSIFSA